MVRDRCGKLPVEYLSTIYPGEVFDIFFRASKSEYQMYLAIEKHCGWVVRVAQEVACSN